MAIETAKLVVQADVTQFAQGAEQAGLKARALAENIGGVTTSTKTLKQAQEELAKSLTVSAADTSKVVVTLNERLIDMGDTAEDTAGRMVSGFEKVARSVTDVVGAIKRLRETIRDVKQIWNQGFFDYIGLPELQQTNNRKLLEVASARSMPEAMRQGAWEQLKIQGRQNAGVAGAVRSVFDTLDADARNRAIWGAAGRVGGWGQDLLGRATVAGPLLGWEASKILSQSPDGRGGGRRADTPWTWGSMFAGGNSYGVGLALQSLLSYRAPTDYAGQAAGFLGGVSGGISGAFGGIGAMLGGATAGPRKQQQDLAEFEAQLNDTSSLLGGGFTALSSGLSSAVDAAVTGSKAIGAAFKQAAAAALKSLAVESTVRAAYQTAMGLGALIFNPSAAAGHFASAAKFAATAVLAGAGSAVLGGGGGGGVSASSGPSSVPYVGRPGGGAGGGAQTIIVNVGGGAVVASPQELGAVVAGAVEQGRRTGRVRDERNVVVRYE